MGKLADCERIVQETIVGLGGLDVIISNAVGSAVSQIVLGRWELWLMECDGLV